MGKSLDRQRDLNKVKFLRKKEHKAKKYKKYGYNRPCDRKKQYNLVEAAKQAQNIEEMAKILGIKLN